MKNILCYLLTILLLCSCMKIYTTSGHLFEAKEIDQLKEARDKQDILRILGTPTTTANFGQESWYYITIKKSKLAFFNDKVVDQNIVMVMFNPNETIAKIDYFNEKSNQNLNLVAEYTPTRGTQTSATAKVFKNIGKFSGTKKNRQEIPRGGF